MFSTFRQRKSASGHNQYVLESTATQLKRPSHRISRLACVYCRSKKIKCTGEEQGCRRCLDKRIQCSYTSATRRETGSAPRRLMRLEQNAGTTGPSVLRPAEDATTPWSDVEIPTEIETQLGWDPIMTDSDLLHTDPDLGQFGISQDMYSTFDTCSSLPFDAFQTVGTVDTAAAASSTISDSTMSDPPGHRCLCSKMLEVYEIAEIGLARVQRADLMNVAECNTTSFSQSQKEPVDELRWQKEVLKNCEMWLSRDAAHIKSQHAMLMVSIFDRLLVSILSIAQSPRDRSGGRVSKSSVSPAKNSSYVGGEEWSCQDADYALEESEWKEDDEETLHVLKSLLSFRVSRLKGLMERLVAIAASNQWPTQTAMVEDMLERLSKRGDC